MPHVKLLDWGIAKLLSGDKHTTLDGLVVGTPLYLAPEQARGAEVTAQTDVYSLGVMAYELFLERLPFEAETSEEVVEMHLRATAPPQTEVWPNIPPELERLLGGMMAKDPRARPTMLEVARSLRGVNADLARRRELVAIGRARPLIALPSRWRSAPGRATTRASWSASRSRQRALGALAIAASATMFVLSSYSDAPAPAMIDTITAAHAAISPARTSARPRSIPPGPQIPAPSASVSRPAAAREIVAVRDEPSRPATTVHRGPPRPAAHRKPPAALRRSPHLDPDGTIEAYR
jgi:serine/threonine protein kinase